MEADAAIADWKPRPTGRLFTQKGLASAVLTTAASVLSQPEASNSGSEAERPVPAALTTASLQVQKR